MKFSTESIMFSMNKDYEEIKTALDFALKNVHIIGNSLLRSSGKEPIFRITIEKYKKIKFTIGLRKSI